MARTTLIIIIVCAVLAALLLLLIAVNILRATHRSPAAPLPPVQPLAHHRILKYDNLDSRPPSSLPDSNPSFYSFDPPPSPVSSLSRPLPPRPLSTASLSSVGHISRHASRTNLRGVPHAPNSQVQIILPTPLSATHIMRRDTESSDRMSLVDKWVPVGRDGPSIRRASASNFSSSFAYPSPPPPVPRIPKGII